MKPPLQPLTRFLRMLVLAAWTVCCAAPAAAQECPAQTYKRTSQTPIIRDMVNPDPAFDDFELPMPCGGKLILRHVCMPAYAFLDDTPIELGCDGCRRQDEGFMEQQRPAALAGTFTLEDLPESWRGRLIDLSLTGDGLCPVPDDENPQALYYFIGKYEMTSWQWQTVMAGDCPGWDKPFTSEDPRPKTNISWFEAVDFTRRYTEWLIQTRAETLPRFPDGRFGYIRLPTEAEWEYAARGGHRASPEQMRGEAFFPLGGRPISDFAVFTQAGGAKPPEKLAWVGVKCPNPLYLFDTAGNAAEMLLDPFRFSVDDRLHGAAGGFIIKGGSFRRSQEEIMPGRREEMPFFLDDGAYRSSDVGFRVVLSGIVTPQSRGQALRREWTARLKEDRKAIASSLAAATPGYQTEGNDPPPAEGPGPGADGAPEAVDPDRPSLTGGKAGTVDALIWEALFAVESIVNQTSRCSLLSQELAMLESLKTETLPETDIESLNRNIPKLKDQIRACRTAIDYWVASYTDSIRNSRQFPQEAIDLQLNLLIPARDLDESLRLSLNGRLLVFRDHVALFRQFPERLVPEKILKDIDLTIVD